MGRRLTPGRRFAGMERVAGSGWAVEMGQAAGAERAARTGPISETGRKAAVRWGAGTVRTGEFRNAAGVVRRAAAGRRVRILRMTEMRRRAAASLALVLGLVAWLGGWGLLEAATLFQTNLSTYDPRVDLRTDAVLVHMHGHDPATVAHALEHWREAGGASVYRMWFIGSDASQFFTSGKFDGRSHTDAIETGPAGDQFWQPGRPYMVPTPEWNEYMRQIVRHAIDSGAAGIAPEEPLAHGRAGYSPAFRRAWEEFYGEPWQPPHSSVNAFWKASKLKSHLYLEAVKAVIDEAEAYGRAQGKDIEVLLATHSLISHAAGSMIFPSGAAAKLSGLDGIIGQVWTGPVGWSLGRYEGKQLSRDDGFFETAWLLYSSFANLTRGTGKRLYLLADPVEDDPNYRWDQYHIWYNQTLVAKLMFPTVTDYEVMPWPERIFLPGYSTGGGSPGPAEYLTQLTVNVQVLADMQHQREMRWHGGTQGIGVLVGDSLGWQRGGPSGSSMDSLYGLVLPLLRRGIPIEVLPIERITDEGYLDPFDVLLVSYDMWKPLAPEAHAALAEWVRRGGVVLFFDGDDAYNRVDEWWQEAGYHAPVEHLFETLGLDVDRSTRLTLASEVARPETNGFPGELTEALEELVARQLVSVTSYVFGGERSSMYQARVGGGAFVYVGVPSALFAISRQGAEFVRRITAYAVEQLAGGEYREDGVMLLERGAYTIAYSFDEERTLPSTYVNLLDPALPVMHTYTLRPGEPALLYDVTEKLQQGGPQVLYASRELLTQHHEEGRSYLISAGPWQTQGVVRLFAGARRPKDVRAYAMRGFGRRLEQGEVQNLGPWLEKLDRGEMQSVSSQWDWDESSKSLAIRFDQWHSGVMIVVEWE